MRMQWDEMLGPVFTEHTSSEPAPAPPFVAVRGLTACSFCLGCSRDPHPSERCSGVSALARRELTPEQLFSTSMCPLDLEDEVWRRKYGGTRAELELVEQYEQDLKPEDDGSKPFVFIPTRWLRRRRKRN